MKSCEAIPSIKFWKNCIDFTTTKDLDWNAEIILLDTGLGWHTFMHNEHQELI